MHTRMHVYIHTYVDVYSKKTRFHVVLESSGGMEIE